MKNYNNNNNNNNLRNMFVLINKEFRNKMYILKIEERVV